MLTHGERLIKLSGSHTRKGLNRQGFVGKTIFSWRRMWHDKEEQGTKELKFIICIALIKLSKKPHKNIKMMNRERTEMKGGMDNLTVANPSALHCQ